jgi:hypothetical protein
MKLAREETENNVNGSSLYFKIISSLREGTRAETGTVKIPLEPGTGT